MSLLAALSACTGDDGQRTADGTPVDSLAASGTPPVPPSVAPTVAGAAPTVPPDGVAAPALGDPTRVVTDASAVITIATTSTAVPRGLDTPAAASRNLWDSWRDNDPERAELFANPVAVAALFRTPWTAETTDQGCSGNAASPYYRCLYTRDRLAWVVVITSHPLGYRVDRVVSDELARPSNAIVIEPNETIPADGIVVDDTAPSELTDPPDTGLAGLSDGTLDGSLEATLDAIDGTVPDPNALPGEGVIADDLTGIAATESAPTDTVRRQAPRAKKASTSKRATKRVTKNTKNTKNTTPRATAAPAPAAEAPAPEPTPSPAPSPASAEQVRPAAPPVQEVE